MVDVVPQYSDDMMPFVRQQAQQDPRGISIFPRNGSGGQSASLRGMPEGYAEAIARRFGVGPQGPANFGDPWGTQQQAVSDASAAAALRQRRAYAPGQAMGPGPSFDIDPQEAEANIRAAVPPYNAVQSAREGNWWQAGRSALDTIAPRMTEMAANLIQPANADEDETKRQANQAAANDAVDERQKAIQRLFDEAKPRSIPPDLQQRIDAQNARAALPSTSAALAKQWRDEANGWRKEWQEQENRRQADAKATANTAANAYAQEKDKQAKAAEDIKGTFAYQHPDWDAALNTAGYAAAVGLPVGRRFFAGRAANALERNAHTLADEWKTLQDTVQTGRKGTKAVSNAREGAATIARTLKSSKGQIEDKLLATNPTEGFNYRDFNTYGKLLPDPLQSAIGGAALYEGRALPHQIDYAALPQGNTQREEAARWTPFSGNYDPRLLGSNMAIGAMASALGRDIPWRQGGTSLPRIEAILGSRQYRKSPWNK